MHEDLERIAIEQEAEERMKTERLVRISFPPLYSGTRTYF